MLNQAGTVTVTTYIDGCVHSIELDPSVTRMTESELAREIRVTADLARMKAQSTARTFLLEGMRGSDDDTSALSVSLTQA